METNPSNLGQYINKATTLKISSLRKPKQMASMPLDLQAILLALIKCTLPFIELIKLFLELWKGLIKKLVEQGMLNKGRLGQVGPAKRTYYEPIEPKKVSGI